MGDIKARYIMPHPPIIIPEIGNGEERAVLDTINSMEKISKEVSEISPDTIVIITPHGPVFRDAIAITYMKDVEGDFGKFGREDVMMKLNIDMEMTNSIMDNAFRAGIPVVPITEKSIRGYDIEGKLDHGAMVPLYYINREYREYNLVHITYGILEKDELYRFGVSIQEAIGKSDKNAVIIASGDLSHKLSDKGPYSYDPRGPEFDKKLLDFLGAGDTESIFLMNRDFTDGAGECGLRSVEIMLGTLDGKSFDGDILSYQGNFGVGYGVVRINEGEDRPSIRDTINKIESRNIRQKIRGENKYIKLARESLKYYIENKKLMEIPNWVSGDMKTKKRGVFVSFKKQGELRGCIGTIYPVTQNIAEEIIRNAVEAGVYDPRFDPIGDKELDKLDISVDELLEPEKCTKDQLDPKDYGVIVESGMKRGLLLPDLEGIDTVDEQISIALRKAGINKNEDYELYRFKVKRHS